jgi:hypothetical protein
MSGITIIAFEIIAPIVILIVYVRIKNAKARRKAAVCDAAVVRPYEPKTEPAPGFFLRSFSAPQRAYLRQQTALGKAFFYVTAWIFIVMFTSGLLPAYVNAYGFQQPLAQRVWYSYLEHLSVAQIAFGFVMLMATAIASTGLTAGPPAIFNRTRPLTHRFLFWARVLSAIATILASLATAAAVSFALLILFYGPVWLHLTDTMRPDTVLSYQQHMHLLQLLQTSALRLFLSRFTTALMIFSAALLVIGPSIRFLSKRFGLPIVVFATVFAMNLARDFHGPSDSLFSRMLFLYTGLGPPPPYAYIFLPILASAVLLFIAQLLIRRVEL